MLGRGSYATVKEGLIETEFETVEVAVKVPHQIFLDLIKASDLKVYTRNLLQESFLHSSLSHEHIVKCIGIVQLDVPLIIMEKMNCTLTQLLESGEHTLSYEQKVSIFRDISAGLSYLHSKSIVHRDLSSNNILLTDDLRAKISDFGTARPFQAKNNTLCPGTQFYMAPDIKFTPMSDVFSLGVLAVQIETCRFPSPSFPTHRVIKPPLIEERIPELERRQHDIDEMDKDCVLYKIAVACLQLEPTARPTAKEILHDFLHEPDTHSEPDTPESCHECLSPTSITPSQQLDCSSTAICLFQYSSSIASQFNEQAVFCPAVLSKKTQVTHYNTAAPSFLLMWLKIEAVFCCTSFEKEVVISFGFCFISICSDSLIVIALVKLDLSANVIQYLEVFVIKSNPFGITGAAVYAVISRTAILVQLIKSTFASVHGYTNSSTYAALTSSYASSVPYLDVYHTMEKPVFFHAIADEFGSVSIATSINSNCLVKVNSQYQLLSRSCDFTLSDLIQPTPSLAKVLEVVYTFSYFLACFLSSLQPHFSCVAVSTAQTSVQVQQLLLPNVAFTPCSTYRSTETVHSVRCQKVQLTESSTFTSVNAVLSLHRFSSPCAALTSPNKIDFFLSPFGRRFCAFFMSHILQVLDITSIAIQCPFTSTNTACVASCGYTQQLDVYHPMEETVLFRPVQSLPFTEFSSVSFVKSINSNCLVLLSKVHSQHQPIQQSCSQNERTTVISRCACAPRLNNQSSIKFAALEVIANSVHCNESSQLSNITISNVVVKKVPSYTCSPVTVLNVESRQGSVSSLQSQFSCAAVLNAHKSGQLSLLPSSHNEVFASTLQIPRGALGLIALQFKSSTKSMNPGLFANTCISFRITTQHLLELFFGDLNEQILATVSFIIRLLSKFMELPCLALTVHKTVILSINSCIVLSQHHPKAMVSYIQKYISLSDSRQPTTFTKTSGSETISSATQFTLPNSVSHYELSNEESCLETSQLPHRSVPLLIASNFQSEVIFFIMSTWQLPPVLWPSIAFCCTLSADANITYNFTSIFNLDIPIACCSYMCELSGNESYDSSSIVLVKMEVLSNPTCYKLELESPGFLLFCYNNNLSIVTFLNSEDSELSPFYCAAILNAQKSVWCPLLQVPNGVVGASVFPTAYDGLEIVALLQLKGSIQFLNSGLLFKFIKSCISVNAFYILTQYLMLRPDGDQSLATVCPIKFLVDALCIALTMHKTVILLGNSSEQPTIVTKISGSETIFSVVCYNLNDNFKNLLNIFCCRYTQQQLSTNLVPSRSGLTTSSESCDSSVKMEPLSKSMFPDSLQPGATYLQSPIFYKRHSVPLHAECKPRTTISHLYTLSIRESNMGDTSITSKILPVCTETFQQAIVPDPSVKEPPKAFGLTVVSNSVYTSMSFGSIPSDAVVVGACHHGMVIAKTIACNTLTTSNHDTTMTSNHSTMTSNHGTMTSNHGTMTSNHGTMTSNHGTMTSNHGTMTSNHGTMKSNHDTIMKSNHGTIMTSNHGTIMTSSCGAGGGDDDWNNNQCGKGQCDEPPDAIDPNAVIPGKLCTSSVLSVPTPQPLMPDSAIEMKTVSSHSAGRIALGGVAISGTLCPLSATLQSSASTNNNNTIPTSAAISFFDEHSCETASSQGCVVDQHGPASQCKEIKAFLIATSFLQTKVNSFLVFMLETIIGANLLHSDVLSSFIALNASRKHILESVTFLFLSLSNSVLLQASVPTYASKYLLSSISCTEGSCINSGASECKGKHCRNGWFDEPIHPIAAESPREACVSCIDHSRSPLPGTFSQPVVTEVNNSYTSIHSMTSGITVNRAPGISGQLHLSTSTNTDHVASAGACIQEQGYHDANSSVLLCIKEKPTTESFNNANLAHNSAISKEAFSEDVSVMVLQGFLNKMRIQTAFYGLEHKATSASKYSQPSTILSSIAGELGAYYAYAIACCGSSGGAGDGDDEWNKRLYILLSSILFFLFFIFYLIEQLLLTICFLYIYIISTFVASLTYCWVTLTILDTECHEPLDAVNPITEGQRASPQLTASVHSSPLPDSASHAQSVQDQCASTGGADDPELVTFTASESGKCCSTGDEDDKSQSRRGQHYSTDQNTASSTYLNCRTPPQVQSSACPTESQSSYLPSSNEFACSHETGVATAGATGGASDPEQLAFTAIETGDDDDEENKRHSRKGQHYKQIDRNTERDESSSTYLDCWTPETQSCYLPSSYGLTYSHETVVATGGAGDPEQLAFESEKCGSTGDEVDEDDKNHCRSGQRYKPPDPIDRNTERDESSSSTFLDCQTHSQSACRTEAQSCYLPYSSELTCSHEIVIDTGDPEQLAFESEKCGDGNDKRYSRKGQRYKLPDPIDRNTERDKSSSAYLNCQTHAQLQSSACPTEAQSSHSNRRTCFTLASESKMCCSTGDEDDECNEKHSRRGQCDELPDQNTERAESASTNLECQTHLQLQPTSCLAEVQSSHSLSSNGLTCFHEPGVATGGVCDNASGYPEPFTLPASSENEKCGSIGDEDDEENRRHSRRGQCDEPPDQNTESDDSASSTSLDYQTHPQLQSSSCPAEVQSSHSPSYTCLLETSIATGGAKIVTLTANESGDEDEEKKRSSRRGQCDELHPSDQNTQRDETFSSTNFECQTHLQLQPTSSLAEVQSSHSPSSNGLTYSHEPGVATGTGGVCDNASGYPEPLTLPASSENEKCGSTGDEENEKHSIRGQCDEPPDRNTDRAESVLYYQTPSQFQPSSTEAQSSHSPSSNGLTCLDETGVATYGEGDSACIAATTTPSTVSNHASHYDTHTSATSTSDIIPFPIYWEESSATETYGNRHHHEIENQCTLETGLDTSARRRYVYPENKTSFRLSEDDVLVYIKPSQPVEKNELILHNSSHYFDRFIKLYL